MSLPREKILKIIAEQEHITVKLENKALLNKLQQMQNEGLVECDYVSSNFQYHYFKAKGSSFRFPRRPSDDDYDPEID